MKIRTATSADVPRIAAIILAAVAAEEPWRAYIPAAARQNGTYTAAVERLVKGYVEAPENEWTVEVVETGKSDAQGNPIIASVAIWDTRAAPPPARRGSSLVSNRSSQEVDAAKAAAKAPAWSDDWAIDPDNDRLQSLNNAFAQGRQQFFAGGGPKIVLRLLATAPNCQRNGYAKALCKSGLEIGWRRQAAVCLQTGVRGYIALSGMGFSDVGAVTIPPVPGQEEQVLKALKMDVAKAQESHPSFMTSFWNYVRN